MKLREMALENYFYQTFRKWKIQIGEKQHQFGLVYEVTNMSEATGEKEYENYPFVVSVSLMAHKCHFSFNEDPHSKDGTLDGLRFDCLQYMGGIPVDHLLNGMGYGIKINDESWQNVKRFFSVNEATINFNKQDYGAIAAQYGKGTEYEFLQFRTFEDAKKYVLLLSDISKTLSLNSVGDILNKPINLAGTTGWDILKKQINGVK